MAASKTAALLVGKCPRCHTGSIFAFPVTRLSRFTRMNEACPHCGVSLQPEPGFYQGAMYVSYGFTVSVLGILYGVLYLLGDPAEWVYLVTIISILVLLTPVNFRYSRIVYLYLFGGIKFDASRS